MYQSDWLLRQIEMMGQAFKRLLQALRERRPEDAVEISREAIAELMDTDPNLLEVLSPDGLVTMLSAGGALDVFRAHMLAELLAARADAQDELGHTDAAAADRHRARVLLQAALPLAEGADAERIAEVLGWLAE